MIEFKLPELGENITSGQCVSILVSVGDTVKKDQDMIEVETDKASLPVPSPVDGVVKEILVKEGDDINVGQVIAKIESQEGAEQTQDTAEKPAEEASGEESKEEASDEESKEESDSPEQTPTQPTPEKTQSTQKTQETQETQQTQKTQKTQQTQQTQQTQKTTNPSDIHLVVIGGGPGGYPAAFHAADHGVKVTMIDMQPNPGGVCLYWGCIPSKALLHAAKVMNDAKEAKDIGITFGEPKLDLDKLRSWKESVVTKLTGGTGQLVKQRNITYIQGRAGFIDSKTLKVERVDGPTEEITFDKAIVATGSRPVTIDAWPKSERIIDSTGALELKDIPKSMLLVGGGVIGLELGTVYAELGTELDVVEMLPHLINGADRDIVAVLEKRLKTVMRDIYLETKVSSMEETSSGILVRFEKKDGSTFEKEYEKVLVAIGRRPNSENIGLENTSVTLDDKGFIEVDHQQLTRDPNIYAIGDIVGQPMLAHKATHEGAVAAAHVAGEKSAFEPKAIPAVVYTDPEVAWCGLTETDAKARGIDYKVSKFPWAASGRAITMARTDGLTKLLFDPKTEIILGMAIVGHGAGELIAEGVLAIEMAATATDIKLSIHPHPSVTETVMESAESFFGSATHIYKPRARK